MFDTVIRNLIKLQGDLRDFYEIFSKSMTDNNNNNDNISIKSHKKAGLLLLSEIYNPLVCKKQKGTNVVRVILTVILYGRTKPVNISRSYSLLELS